MFVSYWSGRGTEMIQEIQATKFEDAKQVHSLTSGTRRVEFHIENPATRWAKVVWKLKGKDLDQQTLPIPDARQLYRSLAEKGWNKF